MKTAKIQRSIFFNAYQIRKRKPKPIKVNFFLKQMQVVCPYCHKTSKLPK